MKPLVILVSFFAAASAGIAGVFGAGSAISGSSGGYLAGGSPPGYSGGGLNSASYSAPNVGFPGNTVGGFGGVGGGFSNSGGFPSSGGFPNGGGDGPGFTGGGGQIRKFVSVHVGPDEPSITQTKVIRAGGAPDKHVQIIFVKAPSNANSQNTEVILPEAPQQKTLVYVLVKKQESSNNVRVRGPAPTKPTKPEVYFIRYKDSPVGNPGPAAGGFPGDIAVGGNVGPGPAAAYGPPPAGVGPAINTPNGGY